MSETNDGTWSVKLSSGLQRLYIWRAVRNLNSNKIGSVCDCVMIRPESLMAVSDMAEQAGVRDVAEFLRLLTAPRKARKRHATTTHVFDENGNREISGVDY